MEGKDMAGPENLRRGILPITAPPRERTATPVLPKPEPRPAPVSAEPKRRKDKKGIGAKTRIALAGLAAVGAGVGAYEAYQNIPAVHRAVDSAFLDHIKGKSSLSEASTEVFDNTATKGVVGPKNILIVPREVFNKTPIADAQGNPIFDFPWDPNHPVSREYKTGLSSSWASWSAKGSVEKVGDKIKNELSEGTSLPAGFEFSTIYPGRLFFAGSVYDEEASRKSPSNPYGLAVYSGPITMAKIEFIAPDGVLYFVNISIQDNQGGGLPLQPLIDAPLINLDNSNGTDWQKGVLIERRQKLFRTTKEGKLHMYIEGGKNGRLDGPTIERVPGDFQFQTAKDAAGIQKILVSDSK